MRRRDFLAGIAVSAVAFQAAGQRLRFGASTSFHYDYLVVDDATWASTFANSSGTLSGKTVAVLGGITLTSPTITNINPVSPVTIRPLNGTPNLDQLVIISSSNLVFQSLGHVSSAWPAARASVTNGLKPAVRMAGTVGALTFEGPVGRGNYQGDVNATYDPTKTDYPEYALIDCTVSAGVLQSVFVASGKDNVSGLSPPVADGIDIPLTFFVGTGATGLVDIVGGRLQNARLTNGGSGFVNAATYSFVSFPGACPLEEWAPFAFEINNHSGEPAANFQGPLTIRNGTFTGFGNVIKCCPQPGTIWIEGNVLDINYDDQISMGGTGSTPFGEMTLCWNVITRTFAAVGDPDDPHPDPFQTYMNDKSAPYTSADWKINAYGNVIYIGTARGEMQGGFFSNNATGKAYIMDLYGNVFLTKGANNTCYVLGTRDSFIWGNIFARYDPSDPANVSGCNVTLGTNGSYGHTYFGANICENFQAGYNLSTIDWVTSPSVWMGTNGTGIVGGYGAVMPNYALGASSVAQVVANYAPAAAYSLMGALRSGYVDFVNRTIDRTLEPTVVAFGNVLDVALGSTNTSLGSKMIGGPSTVAWSISSGSQVRFADDEAMTVNVTAWQTGSGTETKRFAQAKQLAASASYSTSVITTLTLNGTANTFITRTLFNATFPTVSNGGSAYSTITSLSADTLQKKMLIAVRFRDDVRVNNGQILANATANGLTLYQEATGTQNLRFELKNSGVIHARPGPFQLDGQMHTHLIAVDLTKTVREQVLKWVVDKSLQGMGPSSTIDLSGTQTLNMATILSAALGVFDNGGGTASDWTGAMEMLWLGWGDGTWAIPDVTDSTVQDAFLADNIAADGTVAGIRPQGYWKGAAASWNAGIANLGSIASKPLNKATGTYT